MTLHSRKNKSIHRKPLALRKLTTQAKTQLRTNDALERRSTSLVTSYDSYEIRRYSGDGQDS